MTAIQSASKRWIIGLLILLLAGACLTLVSRRPIPWKRRYLAIALVPLGSVSKRELAQAKDSIESKFRAKVMIKAAATLPKSAYYAPRNRYRAEKINAYLASHYTKSERVIGLTSKDISTTHRGQYDWGLFGLASEKCAVVSTYRYKMRGEGRELVESRLRKCVLHELGHTFSLEHCADEKCVMQDGEGGLLTTDRADEAFCKTCTSKIAPLLRGSPHA